MNKKILSLVALSLILMSCGSKEEEPQARNVFQDENVSKETTVQDDQVFSYMLGTQFGRQGVENAPFQIGAHVDVDALVQGFLDMSNDKMQMNDSAINVVDSIYNIIVKERMDKVRPDSATMASFGDDKRKYHAYIDSANRALPVEPQIPIKNEPVTLDESSSFVRKYSYRSGAQLGTIMRGVGKQLEKELHAEFFARGIREVAMNIADSSAAMWISNDSLEAINMRYVKIMRTIQNERRMKGN